MDVSVAMQTAIRSCLVGDATVSALVDGRVLDQWGGPTAFPTIILGDDQVIADDDDSVCLSEVFHTLHVWARGPGTAGAKQIVDAIRRAVRSLAGPVEEHRLLSITFRGARYLRSDEADIVHGVVTLRSLVQEAPL